MNVAESVFEAKWNSNHLKRLNKSKVNPMIFLIIERIEFEAKASKEKIGYNLIFTFERYIFPLFLS